MSTTVLKDSPVSITYEEVRPLLDGIAHRFARHGMKRDDAIGELSLAFMYAYEDYDPSRGTFENCVYYKGYKHLLENVRLSARRNKKLPRTDSSELHAVPAAAEFNVVDFMDELSPDAQRVVRLTLETPRLLAEELEEKGDNPRTFRSIIRAHLIYLGWTRDRVRETFNEIQTVLGSW